MKKFLIHRVVQSKNLVFFTLHGSYILMVIPERGNEKNEARDVDMRGLRFFLN